MGEISPYRFQRGGELSYKDKTVIPADQEIRPLRDNMIVEPLDACLSALIEVVHEVKPLRGVVKAIGPGCYPKRYDHYDKHRRTKTWDSKMFQPTQVKVGETVELGGLGIGGYSFQTFYWGEKLHLICREEDVAAVVDA